MRFGGSVRVLLHLAVVVLLTAGLGCAAKTLQYKDDHDRLVRIDRAVEALRAAYVARDFGGIEALLLPTGHLDQLQRDIQSDFQTFRDIELEWSIERMAIDGDNIDVFIHWQGQWKRDPAQAGTRQRGHGRLAWSGTQSILLRDAEGDLPFGIASRASTNDETTRPTATP